ncbi:MAG: hypothetical protein Ct9H300mP25_10760 [Acidobacteriota bacterium]|nr:MAG: hypothetical protein Ct9H300mP25_10760 [Acidobacteriota bacterium]
MEVFRDYTDQGNKEMNLKLLARHIFAGVVTIIATIGGLSPLAMRNKECLRSPTCMTPPKRIDFDGTLPTGLTWLDNETYFARRLPGDPFESPFVRVDAIGGDRTALIDVPFTRRSPSNLPGVSQADARDLARSTNHLVDPSLASMIITHANTLYHFDIDNNRMGALTQSAGEKSELSMSPNGNFVAFMKTKSNRC